MSDDNIIYKNNYNQFYYSYKLPYEKLENIKYNLSVKYLFYDNKYSTTNYEIKPYDELGEYSCTEYNEIFYIKSINRP